MLELVNRARRDPAAEAARLRETTATDVRGAYTFFNVDLDRMAADIAALPPAPPLAMNPALLAAARLHSLDMATKGYQAHTETNANNQVTRPADRVRAQGYDFVALGENVFAYAKSLFYGFAGLEVDWGGSPATGGMQSPPGHRLSIHDAVFREVGIGIVPGQHPNVGNWVITQDFGTEAGSAAFITGVAYYDFNGNGFYDPGEGIGGVRVDVPGSGFYAVTPNSGGYAIPVRGNGGYTVQFSASGLAPQQVNVSLVNLANAKVDFTPAYSPPVLTGPETAVVGVGTAYSFTPVGAATGYQWQRAKRLPASAVADAESGLADLTAETTGGYAVVVAGTAASGTHAFHLAHAEPVRQSLTWGRVFVPTAEGALEFSSRLGLATSQEAAVVQASIDDGVTWQELWRQPGSDGPGESAFSRRTVSLAALAGQEVRLRFVYDVALSYYPSTAVTSGWLLDDIRVVNADEVLDKAISEVPAGTSFTFVPSEAATYALRVRARVSERFLNWGPVKLVAAQVSANTTVVRLTAVALLAGNQVQIDFERVAGTATQFQLESTSALSDAFTAVAGATLQSLGENRFRLTASTGGQPRRFYRVRGN